MIGKQQIDHEGLYEFLEDHNVSNWTTDTEVAGEKLAEINGRLCYTSYSKPRPGGNTKYLEHIKQSNHGSVIEHATWSFIITNVSRALTHELVRHRAGTAFSQLSQRYVDESVAEYVEPDVIAEDQECHSIWEEAVKQSHDAYVKLSSILYLKELQQVVSNRLGMSAYSSDSVTDLEKRIGDIETKTACRKAARQAARSVLPNATETKIGFTANARTLRHFIEMRSFRHADVEIRKVAVQILKIMQREAPNLFNDYKLVSLDDGTFEATTPYRKV